MITKKFNKKYVKFDYNLDSLTFEATLSLESVRDYVNSLNKTDATHLHMAQHFITGDHILEIVPCIAIDDNSEEAIELKEKQRVDNISVDIEMLNMRSNKHIYKLVKTYK